MPAKGTKRPGAKVRKKEIIEAAIEVFGEKSYHGGTTKEIAEKAGVSERMVFFYFNKKKELYREVIKIITDELTEAVGRGNPPINDVRTFIKMSARNYITFLERNPLKMKIFFQSLDVLADPEIKSVMKKVLDDFYQIFLHLLNTARERGDIKKDVKVETVTVFMLGLIFIASYAEFLDLDWFKAKGEDIYSLGDYFVDSVTMR